MQLPTNVAVGRHNFISVIQLVLLSEEKKKHAGSQGQLILLRAWLYMLVGLILWYMPWTAGCHSFLIRAICSVLSLYDLLHAYSSHSWTAEAGYSFVRMSVLSVCFVNYGRRQYWTLRMLRDITDFPYQRVTVFPALPFRGERILADDLSVIQENFVQCKFTVYSLTNVKRFGLCVMPR